MSEDYRYQDPANPELVHLFHFEKTDISEAMIWQKIYRDTLNHYKQNAWTFKIKSNEDLLYYADAVHEIEHRALHSKNSALLMFGNYFINEMQCDFVVADHEKKLAPVFAEAHKKIDDFMLNIPDTIGNRVARSVINRSNFERQHYFDEDFAIVAQRFSEHLNSMNRYNPV